MAYVSAAAMAFGAWVAATKANSESDRKLCDFVDFMENVTRQPTQQSTPQQEAQRRAFRVIITDLRKDLECE